VHAASIAGDARYRGDDNIVVSLRFADGSVGTVTYTALGDPGYPKERLEVFGEARVAALDDFRSLELARGGRISRSRSSNQDKGFEKELRLFVEAARSGGPMPIPFEQAAATTRATLAILDSLRTGAPTGV